MAQARSAGKAEVALAEGKKTLRPEGLLRAGSSPFNFTATGLTIKGQPTYEQWEDYGHVLGKIKDGVLWALGDWVNFGEANYGEKYAQAIEATGRSNGGLRNAAYVAASFHLSRRRDNLTWSHHYEVASLSPREQDQWLDDAAREGWSKEDLRDRVREQRHAERTVDRAWPAGQYGLILVDPPWAPDTGVLDPTRQIENQYPTMSVEDLVALAPQVGGIAAPDCVLACWVTSQKIAEYVAIVAAWGFRHVTAAVWVKDSIGMGYWFRQRHEFLMVATKGSPATPLPDVRPDSVITAERRGHSMKPDVQYALLEQMFPGVPKVELFARAARDGWAAWGNEAQLREA